MSVVSEGVDGSSLALSVSHGRDSRRHLGPNPGTPNAECYCQSKPRMAMQSYMMM